MANKLYEEESIKAIADAIRENAPETAGDTTYTVAEMPEGVATVREEAYQAGYSLGKSEGGGANADWLVNDSEAEGYIKNRTHYEVPTVIDISWDGDMTDRPAIDLTPLGAEGFYLVKVSDKVYTKEELVGKKVMDSNGSPGEISSVDDFLEIGGVFFNDTAGVGVVYSADELNATLGMPEGYYTNGVYFITYPSEGYYVSELFTEGYVKKLDEKFMPETALVKRVIDGNVRCVANAGWSSFNVENIVGETWSENWEYIPGSILEVNIAVAHPDTPSAYMAMRGVFVMSNTYVSTGICTLYDTNRNALYEVFLRVDTFAKEIYVAARTVEPEQPLATEDKVVELINEALGVIENGTY